MRFEARAVRGLGVIIAAALAACVTKGEHLKITRALEKQVAEAREQSARKADEAAALTREVQACKDEAKRRAGYLESQIKSCKETMEKWRDLLKGEAGRVASLSKEIGEKEAELFRRDREIKAKEEALQRSLERIGRLEGQVERLRGIFDDLREKLQVLVKAGKLSIRMSRGLLVVQLPERILFPLGSAVLKADGKTAIENLTELLRPMKHRWQIAGHTDDTGNERYNWRLSVRRAHAVLDVMLKAGMPPELLSMAGFGQYQPYVANDSEENRSLNRRTELLLVPDLEEILAPVRKPASS
jgi:chemotaxis protein MotB